MNKLVSESNKTTTIPPKNESIQILKELLRGVSCKEALFCEAWGRGKCDGSGICPTIHSDK